MGHENNIIFLTVVEINSYLSGLLFIHYNPTKVTQVSFTLELK